MVVYLEKQVYEFYDKLDAVVKKDSYFRFLRIHKSYLVNKCVYF
ncbi:hypothetical protein DXC31_18890 [Mediterraneibacter gnavus]|uniref:HTH LytTR-type domain-containing protein n=1 Tax=Mediterraneibacter gnavus TaxID=33038 RepID=A0A3E4UNM5_MEDGN|nr:hypothetical protein DXC31_18890 [Mediterraneibacter gnavus]